MRSQVVVVALGQDQGGLMLQQAPTLVDDQPATTLSQLRARAEPRAGSVRVALRLLAVTIVFALVPVIADLAERSHIVAIACMLGWGWVLRLAWGLTDNVAAGGFLSFGPFATSRRGLLLIGWATAALLVLMIACWILGLGAVSSTYLVALLCTLAVLAISAVELAVRAASWCRLRWRQVRHGDEFAVARPRRLLIWQCVDLESGLAVFMLVALSVGTAIVGADQVLGVTEISGDGTAIEPGVPEVRLDETSDLDVLVGLEPVLSYGRGDASPPVEAAAYFAESDSSQIAPIASGSIDGGLSAPPSCVDPERACVLVDNQLCPNSSACTPFTYGDELVELATDENVVTYGRVLRRGRDALPDWEVSPFGDELIGIAQWWYFTPLDDWNDGFLAGLAEAHKVHPADWEQITIGFSAEKPLFVGFSSHCGGRWRTWSDVRPFNARYAPADVLGTLLHVRAERTDGSHGFYFDEYSTQSPDLGGCIAPLARRLIRGHAMVAGISDKTGGDGYLLPGVISGQAADQVLEYPAVWSTGTTTTGDLLGVRLLDFTDGSASDPHGPGAPAHKSSYLSPIRTIFCSSTWDHDGKGGNPEPNC